MAISIDRSDQGQSRASVAVPGSDAALDGVDCHCPLPQDWRLRSGELLGDGEILARRFGAAEGPLVIVAGGISADRFAAGPGEGGWWSGLVAPGAGVDLDRFRVLAFEFAPGRDVRRAFTPVDQADLIVHALKAWGEARIDAFVGASYGGMVGLALAEQAPERLGRLVVISAAHRPSGAGAAWRGVQRRILDLAAAAGAPEEGLALARQLAMTTYRTPHEFEARFDLRLGPDHLSDLDRYLISRGEAWRRRARPDRWWTLSSAIDRHAVDPARISAPVTLIASLHDQLTPVRDMQDLADRLQGLEALEVLDTPYGHDAFLKETARIGPIVARALAPLIPHA